MKVELRKTYASIEPELRTWLSHRAKAMGWRRSHLIRHLLAAERARVAPGSVAARTDGPTVTLAGRTYRLVEVDGPQPKETEDATIVPPPTLEDPDRDRAADARPEVECALRFRAFAGDPVDID